jgi:anthranilate synthase component 1
MAHAPSEPVSARPTAGKTADGVAAGAAELIARWPADRPLAVLTAGGRTEPGWTLLAEPAETLVAYEPGEALALLERVAGATDKLRAPEPGGPPMVRGWAVAISYELGRALEPVAADAGRPADDRGLPLVVAARVEGVLGRGRDGVGGAWAAYGDAPAVPDRAPAGFDAGEPGAATGDFAERVGRVLEYIRAGDVYQVNLTDRFSAGLPGITGRSPRRSSGRRGRRTGAWWSGRTRAAGRTLSSARARSSF